MKSTGQAVGKGRPRQTRTNLKCTALTGTSGRWAKTRVLVAFDLDGMDVPQKPGPFTMELSSHGWSRGQRSCREIQGSGVMQAWPLPHGDEVSQYVGDDACPIKRLPLPFHPPALLRIPLWPNPIRTPQDKEFWEM